jgi:hypothetical protein
MRAYTANDNVRLVASYDGQTPTDRPWAGELEAYLASRDYREIDATMRERKSVCG